MYKNLKIPAVECLENGNYHVYRKLPGEQHYFFQMDHRARKLQESGNKQEEIKEN